LTGLLTRSKRTKKKKKREETFVDFFGQKEKGARGTGFIEISGQPVDRRVRRIEGGRKEKGGNSVFLSFLSEKGENRPGALVQFPNRREGAHWGGDGFMPRRGEERGKMLPCLLGRGEQRCAPPSGRRAKD